MKDSRGLSLTVSGSLNLQPSVTGCLSAYPIRIYVYFSLLDKGKFCLFSVLLSSSLFAVPLRGKHALCVSLLALTRSVLYAR